MICKALSEKHQLGTITFDEVEAPAPPPGHVSTLVRIEFEAAEEAEEQQQGGGLGEARTMEVDLVLSQPVEESQVEVYPKWQTK